MIRIVSACLLAGTTLSWPLVAQAADKPAAGDKAPTAAPAPDDTVPADSPATDIIVIGRGESRQVQRIGAADIGILASGTSPLKAIAKLPGCVLAAREGDAGYRVEAEAFGTLFRSADLKEGASAFLEKRPPLFKGA